MLALTINLNINTWVLQWSFECAFQYYSYAELNWPRAAAAELWDPLLCMHCGHSPWASPSQALTPQWCKDRPLFGTHDIPWRQTLNKGFPNNSAKSFPTYTELEAFHLPSCSQAHTCIAVWRPPSLPQFPLHFLSQAFIFIRSLQV